MRKFILFICFSCFTFMAWGQDSELIRMAESGDVQAQYQLGGYYYYHREITDNYTKAAKWLLKAAEQGHAEAQELIGSCYKSGRGVPKNRTKAESWLLKSAAQEYTFAYYSLGVFYKDFNKEKAIYWFKEFMDDRYKKTGKEDESTAKELRELGVYYDPVSKSSRNIGREQNNIVKLPFKEGTFDVIQVVTHFNDDYVTMTPSGKVSIKDNFINISISENHILKDKTIKITKDLKRNRKFGKPERTYKLYETSDGKEIGIYFDNSLESMGVRTLEQKILISVDNSISFEIAWM